MRTAFRAKSWLLLFSILICLTSRQVLAQLSSSEQKILETLDASRATEGIRRLSTGIVKSPSGAGNGTAVAGSPEEKELANYVEQEMKKMGLNVKQEPFPVRHYQYGPVTLAANGKSGSGDQLACRRRHLGHEGWRAV
jgi:hypothetical protein